MFDGPGIPGQLHASKIPQTTWVFWMIKIAATTLGETGGDALSMTAHLGYLVSTLIFFAFFVVAVSAQCAARSFRPALYWAVIVATTTAGTTMADFADRSVGAGYLGGSLILAALLAGALASWWLTLGTISPHSVTSLKAEVFYWVVILFSNTLGTALGDFAADHQLGGAGLGYEGGALVFAGSLAVLGMLYALSQRTGSLVSAQMLFWPAFVLTRPLGATLGDLLTKPQIHGGLGLSRIASTLAIGAFMAAAIALLPQQPARSDPRFGEPHPGH